MCRGLRHGYGVRMSAPYGDSQLNNPNKNGVTTQLSSSSGLSSSMLIHSNSLQTQASLDLDDPDSPKPEDGFKPNIDRTLASKNGFVLVAKPLDVPMSTSSTSKQYNGDNSSNLGIGIKASGGGGFSNSSSSSNRRNSLTNKFSSSRIPGSNQTVNLLRGLRLKKQKSTSDLDAVSGGASSGGIGGRNTPSGNKQSDLPIVPFSLSPEELDITDPTTVETYTGEWKHDKRNGHGVCDRSDGLKYEGQWHNDMKCGYGVTTFKNGTKEEGKYKNNILIVDSKVKRFFQFSSANIRQRIDDAVKMAQQAQTMALKKAEIAETRAATARDKADQATTAALEADRDSQIAFSVARQYSDTTQQQQLGLADIQMGSSSMMQQQQQQLHHQQPLQQQFEQMLPNLAMPSNGLQRLRIPQHQQQFNKYTGNNNMQYNQLSESNLPGGTDIEMDFDSYQNQQQQQQKQHQYLGPIEPFNGRRGSFRGGSQSLSGYQTAFTARNQNTQMSQPGPNVTPVSSNLSGHFNQTSKRQQPSDPFNDLFDHYKSTTAGSNFPTNFNSRRMPHKQTSLDNSHLSRSSVPRKLPQAGSSMAPNEDRNSGGRRNSRMLRMSSMDHAEENKQNYTAQAMRSPSRLSRQSSQEQQASEGGGNIQQQFKHLVTSGEDLQQQQQQEQQLQLQPQQQQALSQLHPTTQQQQQHQQHNSTNSSGGDMAQSTAGSSYYGGPTQTPSPDNQSSFRSPSSQYYAHQQQVPQGGYPRAFPPAHYQHHLMKQRDVHSLADEQLYMADRRYRDTSLIDKTDFINYDFAISSSPPPSHRYRRRTASLSRNTPSKSSDFKGHHSNTGSVLNNAAPIQAKRLLDRSDVRGSTSPVPTNNHGNNQSAQQITSPTTYTSPINLNSSGIQFSAEHGFERLNHNVMPNHIDVISNNSSHLTVDSSSAASSLLMRKPSLQVRYDPNDFGGLMSREEVAALSHAQREQRRIEAELAEKRAKQPFFHIYLSLKEFIARKRLLLSVLIFNLFLLKLFSDLMI